MCVGSVISVWTRVYFNIYIDRYRNTDINVKSELPVWTHVYFKAEKEIQVMCILGLVYIQTFPRSVHWECLRQAATLQ